MSLHGPTTPLRVFGWIEPSGPRRIVAATTKREVAKVMDRPESWLRNVTETRDPSEEAVALESPGVVFQRPMRDRTAPFTPRP